MGTRRVVRSAKPDLVFRRLGMSVAALLLAIPIAACRRGSTDAPARVVEREETVGRAPVSLRSQLKPPRGTLGDRISWRLDARLGGGATAGTLLLGATPATLDLDAADAPSTVRDRAGLHWSRSFVVRGFDLGAVPLPVARLPVRLGERSDTLEFPQDTVFVDSLTEAITGTLRPDRGPIEPGLRAIDYVVAGLGALLLVGAVILAIALLLRARRRSRGAIATTEVEPPEVQLLRALDGLEAEFPSLARDVFYERLSLALRSYAAATTGVPALDLTTAELRRELDGRERVRAGGRRALIAALDRADLAKFARYRDESAEAMAILREARSIAGTLVIPAAPPPELRPGAGPSPGHTPEGRA